MSRESTSRWISGGRISQNPRVRLFCFPYSGASASIYYTWINYAPTMVDICPIQLPGHGTRLTELLHNDLQSLIKDAYIELEPYFSDVPYVFFGHSFGALFSFELARVLRDQGKNSPEHLFVSGHGAPHLVDLYPRIHTLPEKEFRERIGELNGMSPEILKNNELMELLSPIIRADFSCCETYSYCPGIPFSFPITAFGGLEDKHVSRNDLEQWKIHSTVATDVRLFPGDHFFLHGNVENIVRVILRVSLQKS